MMRLSMLLVVLGTAAQVNAGSFEADVMGLKSPTDHLKPLLASLAQMTTEKDGVRKLGGHDNMSEEDQKALMKCMQACPDLAKMGQAAAGGDPDMEMVCNMMKCISDNDECAVIQKMMGGGGQPVAEGECDRAGQMRDGIGCICGSGCPVSTDMMKNPTSMCASWDCWNTKDECKGMLNAVPCEDAGDTLGPVKCICNSATKAKVGAMMAAGEMIGAPEGTCHDAKAGKDGDSVDICALAKDAPDGDCATMMVDAMDAMKGAAVCEGMLKMMEEGQDDAEKKCVEEITMAVEAKKELAGDSGTESSFAGKAALPSLAMLAIVGLLRA